MVLRSLNDLELSDKRVLVRVDYNVPIKDGKVTDDTRIVASLPTLKKLLAEGSSLILMSHLGRPKAGPEDKYRMQPVAQRLAELLAQEVRYQATDGPAAKEQQSFIATAPKGSISLLENTRFDSREEANDPELARILATYADVYVNDAFGAAHRAHASTEGVARLLPAAAGYLLEKEIKVLSGLLESPQKPFKVIMGGAKVSDKIEVIENLLDKADELLIGGAMAYTFVKAQGGEVGKSLVEDDKLELARDLLERAKAKHVDILLPIDSLCSQEIAEGAETKVFPSAAIPEGWMGLDIGPEAISTYKASLAKAKTILWNGPMGVFEIKPFNTATNAIAETVAHLEGFTIVGGGDSVAAINKSGLADKIDHISTGGGASLELLEGKTLPGVAVLEKH